MAQGILARVRAAMLATDGDLAASPELDPNNIGGGRVPLDLILEALRSRAVSRVCVSAPLFGLVDIAKKEALATLERWANGKAALMLLSEHPGKVVEVSTGMRSVSHRRGPKKYDPNPARVVLYIHRVGIWDGDSIYSRGY